MVVMADGASTLLTNFTFCVFFYGSHTFCDSFTVLVQFAFLATGTAANTLPIQTRRRRTKDDEEYEWLF